MGLFFQRGATDSATPAGAGPNAVDSVETTRSRARQRLIGAVVLLTIGILGFPLIFESQPRPLPVDIPIEIARKEGAPALQLPGVKPAPAKASAPAKPSLPPMPEIAERPAVVAGTAKPASEMITESTADAGREVAAPPTAKPPTPSPTTPAAPLAKAAETPPQPEAAKPAAVAPVDGARAQALLDGKPGSTAPGADGAARFIVQVGAFADPVAARETRLKVERLGLKTYTQIADTAAGKRIRVRVGPFATRADADKAIAKTRAAGLPAAVLTL